MLKIHPLRNYLKFSFIGAILYLITAWKYVQAANYTATWLLFAGNMLFAAVIAMFLLGYNRNRNEAAPAITMVAAGHITAIMGILISCTGIVVLLLVLSPDVFGNANMTNARLANAAPQLEGKTVVF
ncbi:hypothetical protein BH11BAC6_BH11BAC6_12600 [soil metagenome]